MRQFASLGEHGVRYLAKRVEPLYKGVEHYWQMLPRVEVLDITFAAVCTADFKNFFLIKQIYQLTIDRLSDKNDYLCSS